MRQAVYIAAAKRTPIGRFNGALAEVKGSGLGARVVRQLVADLDLDPARVAETIMGQVLTAGAGQNPARQTSIDAGLPVGVPAFTVNKVCGSGLKAIQLGVATIEAGDASIVVAGGQESMSQAPHLIAARRGTKLGDLAATDSVLLDGLVDAFHEVAMGVTGDRLAQTHGITRDAQDAFAVGSHQKALAAIGEGRFKSEIVPVVVACKRDEVLVVHDEQPRADTSLAALARLGPAFGDDGTVTAGNAASLNDGAAATILVAESEAHAFAPLARIVSCATAGVEPMEMGMGAAAAATRALDKAGWRAADVDLVEINEAFAAQALAVIASLGLDPALVNVNGGAVALGHPIGASGARVVVTLIHEMRRRKLKRGLAALCIGGGQGIALCLET
jgi:acetyl-CoA C-acetyltransferase